MEALDELKIPFQYFLLIPVVGDTSIKGTIFEEVRPVHGICSRESHDWSHKREKYNI